jgi:ketosteroid isomerase-like protein
MSQRNPPDLVRDAYEAFARRDLEALAEISDPEIEISSVTGVLAGRNQPYKGQRALAEYLDDVQRIWDEIELLPQEVVELDGDRVLVFGRVRARRRNARVDTPNAWLWKLRQGRVRSVQVYAEPTSDARWLFKQP